MTIVLFEDGKERLDPAKRINCKIYDVHCECRRKCVTAFKKCIKLQEDGMSYSDACNIAYKNFNMPCDKYQD